MVSDICEKVVNWVNNTYKVNYNVSDVYKFDQTLKTPKGNIKLGPLFRDFTKDPDFVKSLTPYGDALTYLRFLSDSYFINICSCRPEESFEPTLNWLWDNDVYFDNFELVKEKVKGDVLIDDYDHNILNFLKDRNPNKLGILFVQPWSINSEETNKIHCSDKRFVYCYSWKEVYKVLNEFHNYIC